MNFSCGKTGEYWIEIEVRNNLDLFFDLMEILDNICDCAYYRYVKY